MTKKRVFITLLLLLLIVVIGVGAYIFYIYNSLTTEELDINRLGVNRELNDKVINVAFFGLDGRDDEQVEGDRTDSIMIGTLDTRDNSVKVTSIMRDTFVKICPVDEDETESTDTTTYAGDSDGIEWDSTDQTSSESVQEDSATGEIEETQSETLEYTESDTSDQTTDRVTVKDENQIWEAQYDKVNAAYMAGGVEASIKTLNENFDLNITDYISVDFNCLMDVIDVLGGIEINIQNDDVLKWTNEYLKESNGYGKRNDPELTELGPQTVTGGQALAYARNRYSDNDFGRSMRQREVVQGIFQKAMQMDALTTLNMVTKVYPYVKTSLSIDEITEYASAILNSKNMTFEDFRIPTNEYSATGFANEIWYLFPDTLVDNCVALHKFIYGDSQAYTPSYTVRQISQVIDDFIANSAYDLTYGLDENVEAGDSAENADAVSESTSSTETESLSKENTDRSTSITTPTADQEANSQNMTGGLIDRSYQGETQLQTDSSETPFSTQPPEEENEESPYSEQSESYDESYDGY